ncbi:MAG: ATP-binding protein [Myxococcales bacterium]
MQGLLLQNDRLASLGTLATSVVHEINNALTFVTTTLDLVEATLAGSSGKETLGGAPAERVRDIVPLLGDVRFGVNQIVALARDVKTFARADDAAAAPLDPRPAIEAALRMAWPHLRSRAALTVEYRPVPAVRLAEGRLAQVLLNLLVNAAQASPPTKSGHEIRVLVQAGPAGEAVVEVSDTGTGIAADVLPHLFEPHFTTKPVGVGTGLGLAICKSIAEAAGGRIEVESTPGQGSRFRVVLPGAARVSEAARPRALVCLADPGVAASARRMLWGTAEVVFVSAQEQAIAKLEAGESFQLLLAELSGAVEPRMMDDVRRLAPVLAERALFISPSSRQRPSPAFLAAHPGRCLLKPFDENGLRAFLMPALVAGD